MADKPATDPLDLLQISRDMLTLPQRYMPTTQLYARVAEIMRDLAQAHTTYLQEVARANAALLAAFTARPAENGDTPHARKSDKAAS